MVRESLILRAVRRTILPTKGFPKGKAGFLEVRHVAYAGGSGTRAN